MGQDRERSGEDVAETPGDPSSARVDDAASEGTTSADTSDSVGKQAEPKASPRRGAAKLWWALPVLMVIEFYAYGRNGRIDVCVGMEGETDFALVGTERTDDNRWRFPRCETRHDLGLRSSKDEKIEEALRVACRGATIFRHQGQTKACVAGRDGWQHRIESHFVPPWDPAYYEHLFWFFY
jgi:hypothetical protein